MFVSIGNPVFNVDPRVKTLSLSRHNKKGVSNAFVPEARLSTAVSARGKKTVKECPE
jgi:hypothetical protein